MNASDLKLKIFRKIDNLEEAKLEQFYGILLNYLNNDGEVNEWKELSPEIKEGILKGVYEIEEGKGIAHNVIIEKYLNKYKNG